MNFEADVYWNKGVLHDVNQDSLVLIQALTSQGRVLMAAICDGMGGMDMGEVASGYLTEELVTWFYDGLLDAIGKKKALWIISRCARRKLYQIQRRLECYANKRSLEIGTTMSMLILWEKRYLIWHLGDSRIYRLKRGREAKVQLLTKDHADNEGRLFKCIGNFGYFVPDFLICSVGFRKRIEMDEMGEALSPSRIRENRIRKHLREIGDAAMRRGERDDISAVYIKVY